MDRRAARAVVEAVRIGLRIKPIQEAVRRSLSKYGLRGSSIDRAVSGITYSVYRFQGLLEHIIHEYTGIDPRVLDDHVYASLIAATYIHLLDEKSGRATRRSFTRVAGRIIAERVRDEGVRSVLMEYVSRLKDLEWSPRSRVEDVMYRFRVSPQLYDALSRAMDVLGEDLEQLLTETLKPPPRVFRVNTLKASVEAVFRILGDLGVEYEAGKYSSRAVRIHGGLPGEVIRLVETGILVPQDEASMVAVELLDPKPASRIADLCAAPGGKTTYLAEYTGLRSRIYSFEIYRDRARRLRLMLERTGAMKAVRVYVEDARRAPVILGESSMDYVLLDPPCSSTGALWRNPDVRWRFNQRDVEELSRLQYELLEAGWRLLRRGGRLLYTVCSLLPLEGEHVIKEFIERHGDAVLSPLRGPFKDSPILPGTMRSYPHIHGVTGFYYALLLRK